jgi:hypothetical protein
MASMVTDLQNVTYMLVTLHSSQGKRCYNGVLQCCRFPCTTRQFSSDKFHIRYWLHYTLSTFIGHIFLMFVFFYWGFNFHDFLKRDSFLLNHEASQNKFFIIKLVFFSIVDHQKPGMYVWGPMFLCLSNLIDDNIHYLLFMALFYL